MDYNLNAAKQFTESKIKQIRAAIAEGLVDSNYKDDICVVVTGSYGREEASKESDIDWYVIFDKDRDASETIGGEISHIAGMIDNAVPHAYGDSGTFGPENIAKFGDMQKNIGGRLDTNETLTRRMLFLLEGNWLYGEELFNKYRQELLEKYIKKTDTQVNIPRFLLNDIIRYYRTIATDFEYKVAEEDKDWGLRNIKLKFSRKLLYFSGIVAVAQLANLEYQERVAKALKLFSQSPLERITDLAGVNHKAIEKYEEFLSEISSAENREELKLVSKENRCSSGLYIKLNNLSIEFSEELHKLIKMHFPEERHPLQHSLVF